MTLWENESTYRPDIWKKLREVDEDSRFTGKEPEGTTSWPSEAFSVYLTFNKAEVRHLEWCAEAAGFNPKVGDSRFTGKDLLEYVRSAALGPEWVRVRT